ncbi:hypothetical protein BKA82DRAFT_1007230 [Pisolithus tinctorius]|uniref:Uncharacterized protein n=1 Tax=Pisolithus tinctorius Marx 270 TaxID=870435 RepID=A0A0C3JDJ5_PISTI|nr:hypothetical protein BKA82DRAFT_1007230 [Pisolithus tinctorius]KIN95731.1 hypothetical protein M404DRAFT_1007230 [Pisolithus tinctorius Marx 270]
MTNFSLNTSVFFSSIFLGIHTGPATPFELDGWRGPKFRAAHPGSILDETGHLASLFLKECSDLPADVVPGRQTKQISVTIAERHYVPEEHMYPEPLDMASPIVALIPITVSIGTSVTCAYFRDRFSFSMILLGTIASGVSCLVIGSGKLTFTHPKAADGCPLGDGVLGTDKEIAVLRGPEGALLLILQGSLSAGRFFASLAISWAYNLWLSALDKEKIQRAMLMTRVLCRPRMKRYPLGMQTSTAVFLHFDPPDEDRPSTVSDETLWRTLYGDAQSAYKAYLEYYRAQ